MSRTPAQRAGSGRPFWPANRRGDAPRERAFTLIELVIAMVLLTIAFGMVGSSIMSALSGAGAGASEVASAAAVNRTVQAFESDLSNALAPARAEAKIRDPLELEDVVQRHAPPVSSDPSDAGRQVAFDDVLRATRDELRIRADVDDARGVECVAWTASRGNGRYVVERAVYRNDRCNGRPRATNKLIDIARPAGAPAIDGPTFRYRLGCNRNECLGSNVGAPCQPYLAAVGGVGGDRLRWIVAVDLHLDAIVQQGQTASRARSSTSVSIDSRHTTEYRTALGC